MRNLFCKKKQRKLCKRWGKAPRNRFTGTGFKPVYAAVVKSYGCERYMKSRY